MTLDGWRQAVGAGLAPGDVIAGKYRVDRLIGAGGMGVVLEAYHLQLEEQVAIKLLRRELLEDADAVGRFEREARSAFKIRSEHVVRIIDVGKLPDGTPYLAMELLQGRDLAALLQRGERLSLAAAVDHVLQACEAIAEGHKLGIVHRDLKPENLFVTTRADGSGWVKVLDFGLSKVSSQAAGKPRERTLTGASSSMGTPHYMSPEQWLSTRDVGPATDIWALGVILYELVTGRGPFAGDGLPQLYAAIIRDEPASLAHHGVVAPAAFEEALLRCLRKDPADRWSNIGELALALAPFDGPRARLSAARVAGIFGLGARPAELAAAPPAAAPVAAAEVDALEDTFASDDGVPPSTRAAPPAVPATTAAEPTPEASVAPAPVERASSDRGDRGDRGAALRETAVAQQTGQSWHRELTSSARAPARGSAKKWVVGGVALACAAVGGVLAALVGGAEHAALDPAPSASAPAPAASGAGAAPAGTAGHAARTADEGAPSASTAATTSASAAAGASASAGVAAKVPALAPPTSKPYSSASSAKSAGADRIRDAFEK